MAEFDFGNLSGLQLNLSPTVDMISKIQSEQENAIRAVEAARRAKEVEELRRHNELVEALKEAGEKGATIVIGDNANGIQIQQNSTGANQTMNNVQCLDYEQVKAVLNEIKEYFDFPKFAETFGDNTENMKTIVEATLEAVNSNEDEGLIKKSLHIIRDITCNAAGSLIASGILALLGQLPIG